MIPLLQFLVEKPKLDFSKSTDLVGTFFRLSDVIDVNESIRPPRKLSRNDFALKITKAVSAAMYFLLHSSLLVAFSSKTWDAKYLLLSFSSRLLATTLGLPFTVLPADETLEVVVKRQGKEKTLTVQQNLSAWNSHFDNTGAMVRGERIVLTIQK